MDPQVVVLLEFPLPGTINAGEENLPVGVRPASGVLWNSEGLCFL